MIGLDIGLGISSGGDIGSIFGRSMYFDGVNDYVGIPTLTIVGDFLISWSGCFESGQAGHIFGSSATQRMRIGDDSSRNVFILGGIEARFNAPTAGQFFDVFTNFRLSRVGSSATLTTDNGYSNTKTCSTANFSISAFGGFPGLPAKGVFYKFKIDEVLSMDGNGIANDNWVDRIGSRNGTVFGTPALYTGQK